MNKDHRVSQQTAKLIKLPKHLQNKKLGPQILAFEQKLGSNWSDLRTNEQNFLHSDRLNEHHSRKICTSCEPFNHRDKFDSSVLNRRDFGPTICQLCGSTSSNISSDVREVFRYSPHGRKHFEQILHRQNFVHNLNQIGYNPNLDDFMNAQLEGPPFMENFPQRPEDNSSQISSRNGSSHHSIHSRQSNNQNGQNISQNFQLSKDKSQSENTTFLMNSSPNTTHNGSFSASSSAQFQDLSILPSAHSSVITEDIKRSAKKITTKVTVHMKKNNDLGKKKSQGKSRSKSVQNLQDARDQSFLTDKNNKSFDRLKFENLENKRPNRSTSDSDQISNKFSRSCSVSEFSNELLPTSEKHSKSLRNRSKSLERMEVHSPCESSSNQKGAKNLIPSVLNLGLNSFKVHKQEKYRIREKERRRIMLQEHLQQNKSCNQVVRKLKEGLNLNSYENAKPVKLMDFVNQNALITSTRTKNGSSLSHGSQNKPHSVAVNGREFQNQHHLATTSACAPQNRATHAQNSISKHRGTHDGTFMVSNTNTSSKDYSPHSHRKNSSSSHSSFLENSRLNHSIENESPHFHHHSAENSEISSRSSSLSSQNSSFTSLILPNQSKHSNFSDQMSDMHLKSPIRSQNIFSQKMVQGPRNQHITLQNGSSCSKNDSKNKIPTHNVSLHSQASTSHNQVSASHNRVPSSHNFPISQNRTQTSHNQVSTSEPIYAEIMDPESLPSNELKLSKRASFVTFHEPLQDEILVGDKRIYRGAFHGAVQVLEPLRHKNDAQRRKIAFFCYQAITSRVVDPLLKFMGDLDVSRRGEIVYLVLEKENFELLDTYGGVITQHKLSDVSVITRSYEDPNLFIYIGKCKINGRIGAVVRLSKPKYINDIYRGFVRANS